jgi:hypothetical protein
LWCSGAHLHRECPQKTNTESTLNCCNCTLIGQKPHPASNRGFSHMKGELQRRRAQRAPKGPSGRTFFFKFTSPGAVLRSCSASRHATPATTGCNSNYALNCNCDV